MSRAKPPRWTIISSIRPNQRPPDSWRPSTHSMKPIAPDSLVDQLCTTCGLCCNGALFRDVRLRKEDHPQRLRRLGLTIERTGTRSCLLQPCAAFDGSLCQAYADRPSRCRAFECHVLRRLATGALDLRAARRRVQKALRLSDQIRKDLDSLESSDASSQPLLRRYAAVMASPIDLQAGPKTARLRGRLLTRVDTFMRLAQAEFLAADSRPTE